MLAWIWLDIAVTVLTHDPQLLQPANQGRMGAARYFFHYELPKTAGWLSAVNQRDMTCATLPEDAF